MNTKPPVKYIFLILIVFFGLKFATPYYQDYQMEQDLNKIPIVKVIKHYDMEKYKLLLNNAKLYKNNVIDEVYYKNFFNDIVSPLVTNAMSKIYLFADENLIMEYSNFVKNINSQLKPEDCYSFFDPFEKNRIKYLNKELKNSYIFIQGKILRAFYENNEYSIIDDKKAMNDSKMYIEKAIAESKIDNEALTRRFPSEKQKEMICKFHKSIYENMLKDKRVDLLRKNLME